MRTEPAARLVKGRYRVGRLLGAGGMGSVWLAFDELLGREVALKEIVLGEQPGHPAELRRQALDEARALARVDHASIVEIFDIFLDGGTPWIVMRHIQGRTLSREIAATRLGERRVAEIGGAVLAALRAVHAAGVVHCDVKPANIVIDNQGGVFLVDFGIAYLGGRNGRTGVLGTLEYMAPERLRGGDFHAPADLWSLGVTLFQALEGYPPFRRDTQEATRNAILTEDPPPPAWPGPLAAAITRLLYRNPASRMGAAELAGILTSIARSPATLNTPDHGHIPDHGRPHMPGPARPHVAGHGRAAMPGPAGFDMPGQAGAHLQGHGHPRIPGPVRGGTPTPLPAPGAEPGEPGRRLAATLLAADPKTAGSLLDGMAGQPSAVEAVRVLMATQSAAAAKMVGYMTPARAAALLAAMPFGEAAHLHARTETQTAAGLLTALGTTPTALRLVEAMTVSRARDVFDYVRPAVVAALLAASTDGRRDRLLDALRKPLGDQVRRLLGQN
ncbi:hypothetical protein Aph01nite_12830 [Acrocarpospora phusangensis]|uniref:non-specific serine/threonine protein kinase n=1 Tax=Acrocarpospora phusangensis TaxID=1070424 RepID=A0A919Q6R9_9ACTN|nr:protein kinase [Acrocarpospora phusangensis]GIH22973.1 hypothetical protein Aph01nite_12830 [Acrocarpospora phusangensis]